MNQKPVIQIRVSDEGDGVFLKQWLMDPVVLQWFPLANEREVEDAVKIWMGYRELRSTYTACIEGVPCGMAVLYLHRYKKLRHQSLFAIVVDEQYRGRGIGTQLLKYLQEDAKKTFQVELLHLEVYAGNPAQNLYERLGFIEYGRQERFLKEKGGVYRDKVNMQLYL